jgi:hypothetical protein
MAREKRIRLSKEELSDLQEFRNENYGESVPYGYIISDLIDDQ